MKIAWESVTLGLIGMTDLVTTIALIHSGAGWEANPVLAFYLEAGLLCFAAAKILLTLGPVYVLEVLRKHRPQSIRFLLRAAIVLYGVGYHLGVQIVNGG